MRVESREVEYAGEQEDHGANFGDPALTARLAYMPRCGNTRDSLGYLFKHGGQTGCQQLRCATVTRSIFSSGF